MTDRADGLRTATVKGTAWSYVSFVTLRLPALVTIVVLTRLIAPSDFGVIALGLVVLTYLDTLNEFGINSAVIYFTQDDDRELSVSFWLSMASGVVAALVMSLLAFPLAAWFDEPQLRSVIPVLSLAFVVNSVGSVHVAILEEAAGVPPARSGRHRTRRLTKAVVVDRRRVRGLGRVEPRRGTDRR